MADSRNTARPTSGVQGVRLAQRAGKAAGALVSLCILVGLFAYLILFAPLAGLNDPQAAAVKGEYRVAQLETGRICPARMSLADSGAYGDESFRTSAGNIESSLRAAAVGSVAGSSVSALNGQDTAVLTHPGSSSGSQTDPSSSSPSDTSDTPSANTLSNPQAAPSHTPGSLYTLNRDTNNGPAVMDTTFLKADAGTGSAGSVVSWATQGDLRGISSASCVQPQLAQSFLSLPTRTGWAQKLVLMNASSKATVATVSVHGTSGASALALSSNSTVTVGARSQAVVDLSAAASGQDGLYVTVRSSAAPLAGVITATHMDGLNPQGSDYITPLPAAANRQVIGTLGGGRSASVIVYSAESGNVRISWITSDGVENARTASVEGGKVTVVSLGDIPDNAKALQAESDTGISAAAVSSTGTPEQGDFAFIPSQAPASHSVVAIPDKAGGTLTVTNTGQDDAEVTVSGYGPAGSYAGSKNITVKAGTSQVFAPSDIAENAAVLTVDTGKSAADSSAGTASRASQRRAAITMSLAVTVKDVSDASVNGISALNAASLDPPSQNVAVRNGIVVR